ncbi:MAG TPA: S8 family serine peptidase [Thermoleophilaceae bacterium]|nr:S8 family serine peptidase [Thermoleophilaceae bacterium]
MSAAAGTGVLVLAVVVAFSIGGTPDFSLSPASSGATPQEKLSPTLAAVAADRPEKRTEVIVRMQPGETTSAGRALVERAGGSAISRDLPIINGFGAELRAGDAARLAEDQRVLAVSFNGSVQAENAAGGPEDAPVTFADEDDDDRGDGDGDDGEGRGDRDDDDGEDRPRGDQGRYDNDPRYACPDTDVAPATEPYPVARDWRSTDPLQAVDRVKGAELHSVDADEAWQRATGKGVGVAVIDTGIADQMPEFRRYVHRTSSRVVATAVTNPCALTDTDSYGHGTHVAGLIGGNSLMLDPSDPAYGTRMGVAPEANLVSVKVADEDGNATVLDVIAGLQFVVEYRKAFNIRVANLSLAAAEPESYRLDPLDAAVEQAWFAGVVVVAAAGNGGDAPDAVHYAPGNDPFAIAAGAVNDRNTRATEDDLLATWSSRGVTQDGFHKPDVLAPGTSLAAPVPVGSDLTEECPDCTGGGRYFKMGGTSMSAALVSGVAALILEENPDWTPNQVKGALRSTLTDVPGVGGEVSALKALDATDLTSNVGVKPSHLIRLGSGRIDWRRASFRRASFRRASFRRASFRRASFRLAIYRRASFRQVLYERASYRRASFRKTADFDK